MISLIKASALAPFLMGAAAAVAQPSFPVIKEHGGIQPTVGAMERPDQALRYRVVFNVTKPTAAGKSNPTLERVARFVNLLGADGVRPRAGDLVAIIHGAATPSVMKEEAFKARYGSANPDLAVIAALRSAGVEVHVCSQALAGNKIARSDLNPLVQVDVAALTTLANLQLRGYALIPD